MAIVVEMLNRAGRPLSCSVYDKEKISIGRGYDNDFVVMDTYVDPVHLHVQLTENDDQFLCVDQGSINGVLRYKGKEKIDNDVISTGDLLVIGKTILRISSSKTTVPPAVPMSFWEELGDFLSQWWVTLLLVLAFSGFMILDINMSNPLLENKSDRYMEVIYFLALIGFCSGICAFLGRMFHHDSRFLLYFGLLLIALTLFSIYDLLSPLLLFGAGIIQISGWFDDLFYSIVTGVLVYICFRFFSHTNTASKVLIASVIPGLIIVNLIIDISKGDDNFKYFPPYDALVLHESLYWGGAQSQDEFLMSTQDLYFTSDKNP
jgi:hypothetical protein